MGGHGIFLQTRDYFKTYIKRKSDSILNLVKRGFIPAPGLVRVKIQVGSATITMSVIYWMR